jgi:hypothetical protein
MIQAILNYIAGILVLIAALKSSSYTQCAYFRPHWPTLPHRLAPAIAHISMPLHRILAFVLWNG